MSAPTDLLAEDVRDLRESNHAVASEIKALQNGQATIHTELATIKTELKFIKWLGGFSAALLMGVIGGAGSVIWSASALSSEVRQQGSRLEKVEGRLDRIDQQLGQIIQRLDQAKPRA